MKSNFKFSSSRILSLFKKPLTANAISFHHLPLTFSQKVLSELIDHWNLQLQKKKNTLRSKNISSEIKFYSLFNRNEINALYVNDKAVMYPGDTITLRDFIVNENEVQLVVSEILYPFITALSDKNFIAKIPASENKNLRPSLAVCTFAITADNFLVLTIRGEHTNVYPGRFYGQGGNPTNWNVDLLQHQLDEMKEELMLNKEEVQIESLRFCGLVEDLETFKGKPDLIGYVNIFLTSKELKIRFDARPKNERPADVADIFFIPFTKKSITNFLEHETKPSQFCPPAYGGLKMIESIFWGDE